MWHFKTVMGIFWIVRAEESEKFFLGIDEESLGTYKSYQDALDGINTHMTGYLAWDTETQMHVPASIESWMLGEPAAWA